MQMLQRSAVRLLAVVAGLGLVPFAEARSAGHAVSGGGYHGSAPAGGGYHMAPGGYGYHPAAPVRAYPYHGVAPVPQGNYSPRPYVAWGSEVVTSPYWLGGGYYPYRYGWGFGYEPFWWGYRPAAPYVSEPGYAYAERPDPWLVTLGAQAQGFTSGGGSLGGAFAVEKNRVGLEAQYTGIYVPGSDGSTPVDTLKLFNVNLTYAAIANEHGRLRLGLGVDSAFAPTARMIGPGVEAGAVIGLLGPIGIEGNVNLTPWPFTQLDWNAGGSLALGNLGIRAGWRRIWFNDNGLVNGSAKATVFDGPYVAIGLVL